MIRPQESRNPIVKSRIIDRVYARSAVDFDSVFIPIKDSIWANWYEQWFDPAAQAIHRSLVFL